MSRDDLRTLTSSSPTSSDGEFVRVTGTDVGSNPTKKRALDVAVKETVPITATSAPVGVSKNTFGSITSLASGTETTVASFTVPVGKTFFLQHCEASGTNIATYSVFVGGARQARLRTFWGYGFNVKFDFDDESGRGLSVAASTVIEVKVIHSRSLTGDFDARILGVEA